MSLKKLNPKSKNNTDKTKIELFWNTMRKVGDCHEWAGAVSAAGYGIVGFNYKSYRAHRFAWELHNGLIPKGKQINHHCDNKLCCNINHLYIGTQLENVRDQLKRKRRNQKGSLNNGAKLTENSVRCIKDKLKEGSSLSLLAEQYFVSQSTIKAIAQERSWSWV